MKDITSMAVFMKFVRRSENGDVDASGILSRKCFELWVSSRKQKVEQPEKSFQRAVIAHLAAKNGRRPFDADVERSLLERVRKPKQWPCFIDSKSPKVGQNGFRGVGYHEKQAKEAAQEPSKLISESNNSTDSLSMPHWFDCETEMMSVPARKRNRENDVATEMYSIQSSSSNHRFAQNRLTYYPVDDVPAVQCNYTSASSDYQYIRPHTVSYSRPHEAAVSGTHHLSGEYRTKVGQHIHQEQHKFGEYHPWASEDITPPISNSEDKYIVGRGTAWKENVSTNQEFQYPVQGYAEDPFVEMTPDPFPGYHTAANFDEVPASNKVKRVEYLKEKTPDEIPDWLTNRKLDSFNSFIVQKLVWLCQTVSRLPISNKRKDNTLFSTINAFVRNTFRVVFPHAAPASREKLEAFAKLAMDRHGYDGAVIIVDLLYDPAQYERAIVYENCNSVQLLGESKMSAATRFIASSVAVKHVRKGLSLHVSGKEFITYDSLVHDRDMNEIPVTMHISLHPERRSIVCHWFKLKGETT